jgi:hypothetical protein
MNAPLHYESLSCWLATGYDQKQRIKITQLHRTCEPSVPFDHFGEWRFLLFIVISLNFSFLFITTRPA